MTHGRDHRTSKEDGTARAASPAGRNNHDAQEVCPVNRSDSIREEPTVGELIAAREQTDAGLRLAMPMLFDGLGVDPDPEPIAAEVDEELIGKVAAKVAGFRDEFASELHHLDKHAPRRLYIEAQAMVSECDDFLALVAAHFREVGS
jgi:hypothetical protein